MYKWYKGIKLNCDFVQDDKIKNWRKIIEGDK